MQSDSKPGTQAVGVEAEFEGEFVETSNSPQQKALCAASSSSADAVGRSSVPTTASFKVWNASTGSGSLSGKAAIKAEELLDEPFRFLSRATFAVTLIFCGWSFAVSARILPWICLGLAAVFGIGLLLNRNAEQRKNARRCYTLAMVLTLLLFPPFTGFHHSVAMWLVALFPVIVALYFGYRYALQATFFAVAVCFLQYGLSGIDLGEHYQFSAAAQSIWLTAIFVVVQGLLVLSVQKITRIHSESQIEAGKAAIRARARAQSAQKAKSFFLSNMSHELRTPMTGILSMVNDLSDASSHSSGQIQVLQSCGKQLMTVLDSVSDLSKLEAGRMVLVRRRLAPVEIVNEVLELHREQAKLADLHLDFVPPHECFWVLGDRERLISLFSVFVDNAIKFGAKGQVTVSLAEEPGRETGGMANEIGLYFSVRDEGVGISEAQQQCLFDVLKRTADHSGDDTAGAGLGLVLAQGLVDLMQGSIEFHSQEGQGTTFRVRIYLEQAEPFQRKVAA